MSYVYHFTRRENVPIILEQGLNAISKFNKLNSKLREKAVYAWLIPEHDKMGYLRNKDYVCLEVKVTPRDCLVADMDIISAAFVNSVGTSEQAANLSLSKELVSYYDRSAVPMDEYRSGMFRAPEVIIPYPIAHKYIKLRTDSSTYRNSALMENSKIYQKIWLERLQFFANHSTDKETEMINMLSRAGIIQKVAVHDDSDGLLATYEILQSKEYFTTKSELSLNKS